jgi:hypothetical protein
LSGVHHEGVSYSAAARSQKSAGGGSSSQAQQVDQYSHSTGVSVNDSSKAAQANSVWLDALEAQVAMLSTCFQGFLKHFNTVAKAVTSIEQTVETIAKCVSVSSHVEIVRGSVGSVADVTGTQSTSVAMLPVTSIVTGALQVFVPPKPMVQLVSKIMKPSQSNASSLHSSPPVVQTPDKMLSDDACISGIESSIN